MTGIRLYFWCLFQHLYDPYYFILIYNICYTVSNDVPWLSFNMDIFKYVVIDLKDGSLLSYLAYRTLACWNTYMVMLLKNFQWNGKLELDYQKPEQNSMKQRILSIE